MKRIITNLESLFWVVVYFVGVLIASVAVLVFVPTLFLPGAIVLSAKYFNKICIKTTEIFKE